MNCNRGLYKQYRSFCTLQAKKAGNAEQDTYHFAIFMFGFCASPNINRVPGYKETDPDVQFADNYLGNPSSTLVHVHFTCYVCIRLFFGGDNHIIIINYYYNTI